MIHTWHVCKKHACSRSDVGAMSERRRPDVGATSGRCRPDVGATSERCRSGVGPMSERRRADIGPTSARRRSDIDPSSPNCSVVARQDSVYILWRIYACLNEEVAYKRGVGRPEMKFIYAKSKHGGTSLVHNHRVRRACMAPRPY